MAGNNKSLEKIKAFVLIALAAVYTVWPIDVIPDLIPLAGWADDAGIIFLAVKQFIASR